jgi:hypothetical protein
MGSAGMYRCCAVLCRVAQYTYSTTSSARPCAVALCPTEADAMGRGLGRETGSAHAHKPQQGQFGAVRKPIVRNGHPPVSG